MGGATRKKRARRKAGTKKQEGARNFGFATANECTLIEVLRKVDHDALAWPGSGKSGGLVNAVAGAEGRHLSPKVAKNELVDVGRP
jgi:hypothetical protein